MSARPGSCRARQVAAAGMRPTRWQIQRAKMGKRTTSLGTTAARLGQDFRKIFARSEFQRLSGCAALRRTNCSTWAPATGTRQASVRAATQSEPRQCVRQPERRDDRTGPLVLARRHKTVENQNGRAAASTVLPRRRGVEAAEKSARKMDKFSAGCWSERRDSNPRPPVPQTGALTGLRYAPTGPL